MIKCTPSPSKSRPLQTMQTDPNMRSVVELPVTLLIVKMACNGKRSLNSASKSLLITSCSLKTLWYEGNTPLKMPRFNHCNCFSHYCDSLSEESEEELEEEL